MKVLIGGEYSGTIRDAFIARGHNAMSCDFSPSIAPGSHYQGDWWDIMHEGWDLAIFHPTCTHMANSGAKHLYLNRNKAGGLNEERWVNMGRDAWKFWELKERCPIPHFAIENPIMLGYAQLMAGKPNQTVQPWWFGDKEDGPDNCTKATCWWLHDLPKLQKTGALNGKTARDEVHQMPPTQDPNKRRMARSKFYQGMANAIADQWGKHVSQRLAA